MKVQVAERAQTIDYFSGYLGEATSGDLQEMNLFKPSQIDFRFTRLKYSEYQDLTYCNYSVT